MNTAARTRTGYTLIELLIVMAIIGILTALIVTNLQAARQRGRDARRKSDLNTIQQALRLYYHDHSSFPLTAGLTWGSALQSQDLATTYLTILPLDPASTPTNPLNYYYYSLDGSNYIVGTNLENPSDPDITSSQARCPTLYPGGYTTTFSPNNALAYVVCEE